MTGGEVLVDQRTAAATGRILAQVFASFRRCSNRRHSSTIARGCEALCLCRAHELVGCKLAIFMILRRASPRPWTVSTQLMQRDIAPVARIGMVGSGTVVKMTGHSSSGCRHDRMDLYCNGWEDLDGFRRTRPSTQSARTLPRKPRGWGVPAYLFVQAWQQVALWASVPLAEVRGPVTSRFPHPARRNSWNAWVRFAEARDRLRDIDSARRRPDASRCRTPSRSTPYRCFCLPPWRRAHFYTA